MKADHFGSLLLVLMGAFGISLQLLIVATFVAYADYRKTMCIRMMLSISVLEAIQLSCHFLMSLAVVFEADLVGRTATVIGAAVVASWSAMLPQHTLLALNRFLVLGDMCGRGARNRYSSIIFNILLSLCWLWGIAFFVLLQTPLSEISFIRDWSAFKYNANKTFASITGPIGTANMAASPSLCLAIYLVILFKLVRHRRLFSISSSDRWANNSRKPSETPQLLNKAELCLLLQSFLGFTLIGLLIIANYLLSAKVIPITKSVLTSLYGLWIMCCTFSSVLYLVINKTLRRRAFLLLFHWSKERDSSTITVSHISVTQKVTMRPRAFTS
ncbi:hypothetical protein DdX_06264 [Ditylenchus destructor]|uniref:Uncharacterized protein n=1 Tax=Ditylenchus destructor TaxID=166010 RepID=A0AAD4N9B9_9BILA|nr:hypothetical protein DdX_06264 [Ditylenchus destructor]